MTTKSLWNPVEMAVDPILARIMERRKITIDSMKNKIQRFISERHEESDRLTKDIGGKGITIPGDQLGIKTCKKLEDQIGFENRVSMGIIVRNESIVLEYLIMREFHIFQTEEKPDHFDIICNGSYPESYNGLYVGDYLDQIIDMELITGLNMTVKSVTVEEKRLEILVTKPDPITMKTKVFA